MLNNKYTNIQSKKAKKQKSKKATMSSFYQTTKIEKREDPYNEGSFFTKEQFVEYYGSTLEWEFMSPEKVFKRNIIGLWIVDNSKHLPYQSVNHLIDKMIETFL